MKKIVILTSLVASMLASVASVSANTYIDPRESFNAEKFFRSIPTGQ